VAGAGQDAGGVRVLLSNARTEQINTQIRLITRRGLGYHTYQAVIALAMPSLGGPCPPLPGR
jgi:transposase